MGFQVFELEFKNQNVDRQMHGQMDTSTGTISKAT